MRRRSKGIVLAVGALALLGFLLYGGADRTAPESEAEAPGTGVEEVSFPMPEPAPQVPLAEQARGVYALSGDAMQIMLDLQEGRRFVFTTVAPGFGRREGRGTWSLSGETLTLAYTSIAGKPEITPETPHTVVNKWYGDSLELLETGRPERVILKKYAAIRNR